MEVPPGLWDCSWPWGHVSPVPRCLQHITHIADGFLKQVCVGHFGDSVCEFSGSAGDRMLL